MKSSKLLKKGDIVIIASVAVISLLWIMITFVSSDEKQQARIYLDGEIYSVEELSAVEGEKIINIDGCSVKITRDGACFLSSDCPDGLCVNRGMMKNNGDVMACVPKGITVEITGRKAVDGISY